MINNLGYRNVIGIFKYSNEYIVDYFLNIIKRKKLAS